jgi:glycosyltransferase involved in cell wall biosynthesis
VNTSRRGSPRFSVIIPCHNGGPNSLRALHSVFHQSLKPYETIVVDDGSTDDGIDQIRALYPWVVVHSQPQSGAAVARNVGSSLARGDWIAYLDADDVWSPNHLEALAEAAQAFPDVRFVGSRAPARIHLPDGEFINAPTRRSPRPIRSDYFRLARRYRLHGCVHISSVAIRRDIYTTGIGVFPAVRLSEDMAFFSSVGAVSDISWIRRPTVTITRSSGSVTSQIHLRDDAIDCERPFDLPHYRAINSMLNAESLVGRRKRSMRRYRDDLIARHWITVIANGHQRCARAALPSLASNWTLQANLFRLAAHVPDAAARILRAPASQLLRMFGIPMTSPFQVRELH